MRVLLVGSKFLPEYAGPTVRLLRTYERIEQRIGSIDKRCICNSQEFLDSEKYVHDSIPVQRVVSSFWRQRKGLLSLLPGRLTNALAMWSEAWTTFRLLAQERDINIVHTFGTSASVSVAVIWARRRGIPLLIELVVPNASPVPYIPLMGNLLRTDLKKNTIVVAISSRLKDRCSRAGLTANVWNRPNPVEQDKFSVDYDSRKELRAAMTPFGSRDVVISSVAKFMPRKNQLFLVDVLAHLPVEFKLVLAGPKADSGELLGRDDDYLQSLTARIKHLGLADRVMIELGFVDAEPYMKLADVYVVPAWYEGLGTPMLESLSCGVPVVANRAEESFREWIKDGHNGFLCDLDADQWSVAIQKAARFPRQQMIDAASEVSQSASSEVIDAGYVKLLQTLAGSEPGDVIDVASVLN
jgi:glycosyltransferase involved in cell wall biosynthesis